MHSVFWFCALNPTPQVEAEHSDLVKIHVLVMQSAFRAAVAGRTQTSWKGAIEFPRSEAKLS